MIRKDLLKRSESISRKWRNFKKLRNEYYECLPGHPDFLDWAQRDQIVQDLLDIIDISK
jgi:hypothetical protein